MENGKAVFESAVVDAADLLVSACVRHDLAGAQHFVEGWVGVVEARGGRKAVDQGRLTARAVRVGEEVEHLEAAWVGKVRGVGVNREGEGGVRGVCGVD